QLWGLDPGKRIDRYLVDQWQTAQGLQSNKILAIARTDDGYLWFRTDKGLIRFDGVTFTNIPFVKKGRNAPLERAIPNAFYVDRAGCFWVGSAAGLTLYDCKTSQFEKTLTTADGMTGDKIRHIKEDIRGNLWISFVSGYVDRYSRGKFKTFNNTHGLEGKRINTILEDRTGNLLFGSDEKGIFIFKNETFTQYPVPGLDNSRIVTMFEDSRGSLWIGTIDGLFRVTDNNTERYTTADGLPGNHISDILADSDRNLWIGTTKGLCRLKKQQNQNSPILFEPIPDTFEIMCLYADNEGHLWAGTQASGIIRLKDGTFFSDSALDKFHEEKIESLFQDRNGDTWVGTVNGKLFRRRANGVIQSLEPPKLAGTIINAIAEDAQGNFWLGTIGKGVFQWNMDSFKQFTTREGLADNQVTSITKDSRGNLWFSTFDGVSVRYSDGTFESLNSRSGLSGKRVHNVYEDKYQNIWIAADKGITLLKDGKIAKQNIGYYLEGIPVTSIYEDSSPSVSEDRIFWIATHGKGFKRLRIKDGKVTSYKTYTAEQGMTTDFIYQFIEDQRGNFWLMTNSGILRVSKTQLNRFADGETDQINCISFGVSDGLKSLEFNNKLSRHSALKTRNNEFWFTTNKGISIVNPGKIPINKTPPPVVIETALFDRQTIPLNPGPGDNQFKFKGVTDIRFRFTAPTFRSPKKIKFKYQLEGFDLREISLPPGKERVAYYKELPPGTYTFRVTARNAEGIWNQDGDSFVFTLTPFWYQTTLIKIIILLLLVILTAAAYYLYKKYKERPPEKDGKFKYKGSTLNPDFAEQCINKITFLIETEKIYRDVDISLQSLAGKLSITPHQLSQLLNEQLECNFPDFINSHRVEEAKKIMRSPDGSGRKITMVALDVGFNAMPTFYRAFRKFTGMTPNHYKEQVQNRT
ncbi:MAG: helix-turn-helix domain-containing protein, partial [bacterium]|nr:helix-turn-helix domain-containing protein [bacterium]